MSFGGIAQLALRKDSQQVVAGQLAQQAAHAGDLDPLGEFGLGRFGRKTGWSDILTASF
ncbi:MAG: hypothetical protein ACLQU2_18760 [Candidatus Binataceae bacterium]